MWFWHDWYTSNSNAYNQLSMFDFYLKPYDLKV